jgi:hypothetical protein
MERATGFRMITDGSADALKRSRQIFDTASVIAGVPKVKAGDFAPAFAGTRPKVANSAGLMV